MEKIALGGGCHWCTEAVFSHLNGVTNVLQGWVSSKKAVEMSEAIIISYDPQQIPLDILIEIHLYTHSATANHSMRGKYRSAIYTFSPEQELEVEAILKEKQSLFEKKLITEIYPFKEFRKNREEYLNYYKKNSAGLFCQRYIEPKLHLLRQKYKKHMHNL